MGITILGHVSAPVWFTEQSVAKANEMNFLVKHAPVISNGLAVTWLFDLLHDPPAKSADPDQCQLLVRHYHY